MLLGSLESKGLTGNYFYIIFNGNGRLDAPAPRPRGLNTVFSTHPAVVLVRSTIVEKLSVSVWNGAYQASLEFWVVTDL